jgi:hypothetical protein
MRLAYGTNMPPPAPADYTISKQPFGLPFSLFSRIGGLELRNAIQLLPTKFALYKELKKGWKKIVMAV